MLESIASSVNYSNPHQYWTSEIFNLYIPRSHQEFTRAQHSLIHSQVLPVGRKMPTSESLCLANTSSGRKASSYVTVSQQQPSRNRTHLLPLCSSLALLHLTKNTSGAGLCCIDLNSQDGTQWQECNREPTAGANLSF